MIKITEYDSSLLNFSLLLNFVRYRVIIPWLLLNFNSFLRIYRETWEFFFFFVLNVVAQGLLSMLT